jgi:hypothetical protein
MANLVPDRSSLLGFPTSARPAGLAVLVGLYRPMLLPDQFSQPLLGLFQRFISGLLAAHD